MKYRFRTTPFKHQVEGLKVLLRNNGGALFMDRRTGKTKTAIDFSAIQAMKRGPRKILVICPKSVLSVWPLEIMKHCPVDAAIEWRITNYDRLADRETEDWIYEGEQSELIKWLPDGVILDESHKIKNPQSKRSKAIHRLCNVVRANGGFVILATGSFGDNPLDMFSQFKAYDPSVFGDSWRLHKREYAITGGYGGFQVLKYVNLKKFRRKYRPHAFVIKKEECFDLPARTHQVVPVPLTSSRGIYDDMARESLVELLGEGSEPHVVEAPIVLTRLLRLSQITGGFLPSEEGKAVSVGTEKADQLSEMIAEFKEEGVKKVVVFCRFLAELKEVARVCKEHDYRVFAFHGGVTSNKRERMLAAFDEIDKPIVFVAQVSTGALGISLKAADITVFYSHPYSLIDFDQAVDRTLDPSKKRPLMYYHFISPDTVDEAVWLALRTKRDLVEVVLKRPELLGGGDDSS